MFRTTLGLVCALAIALATPAFARPDHDGGDDHSGGTSQSGGRHGDGDQNEHGNSSTTGSTTPAASPATPSDDHGNDGQPVGQNENQNESEKENQNEGNGSQAQFERFEGQLAVTSAGMAIAASGRVEVRVEDQRQRLRLEIEANVPDGTTFKVLADGVMVGTLTIRFDEAELELDSEEGAALVGGLIPGAITSVGVTDATGATVLQAQFGALAPGTGQPPARAARERVDFSATAAGMLSGASGHVSRRVDGQRQRLSVEVEANVADGSVFNVVADGVMIGKLTFQFREAELQLESEDAMLPSGLSSISGIKMVKVTDASGSVLLTAAL